MGGDHNNSFMVFLAVVLSLATCAGSEVYMVGDGEGWNSDINFNSWSQKHNFSVGDTLVFNYVKTDHNVYEVTEEGYRSCDASSGVVAKYDSGYDRVQLKEARKYCFICTVDGHCFGGMRLMVDVKPTTNATFNSSTTGASTSPPDSSSTPTSCSSTGIRIVNVLATFGLILLGCS